MFKKKLIIIYQTFFFATLRLKSAFYDRKKKHNIKKDIKKKQVLFSRTTIKHKKSIYCGLF